MLTRRGSMMPAWALALVMLIAVIGTSGLVTSSAYADGRPSDDCVWQVVEVLPDGTEKYGWVCDEGGGGGDDGDNGGGQTCEFYGTYDEWCEGEAACWGNNPAANKPEDLSGENDPGPRPSPEHELAYKDCRNPDGSTYDDWYWAIPPEPPLEDQAWEAFGQLSPPAFSLAFGPDTLAYVGMDTHFWVDGPGNDEITGSSAFGVVAIGTPDHIEVKAGDGSGTINCPWATSETADCMRKYAKSSSGGGATAAGQPAFTAQARLVYSVRFEDDGAPFTPPGLPTTLESPWESTPVPVAEIQVIVE